MPMHMKDLVAHVSSFETTLGSSRAFVRGLLENVASVRSKSDVAFVLEDVGNNLDALAAALIWHTEHHRTGMAKPVGVEPPERTLPPPEMTDPRITEPPPERRSDPIERGVEAIASHLNGLYRSPASEAVAIEPLPEGQENRHEAFAPDPYDYDEPENGPIDPSEAEAQS